MSDNVAHALAGAGGGMLAMAITYPLITLSTRAQVQQDTIRGGRQASQSIVQALKKVVASGDYADLFSGLNSALVGIGITNGVYYFFYEWTRSVFEKASKRRGMTTIESMTAGALAGAATVIITNPIWVVNTRLTVKKDATDDTAPSTQHAGRHRAKRPGTYRTILRILREDGPLAFWQGVVPALILVINPIIQYTLFEQLKNWLSQTRKLSGWHFFILGAISKLAATSITYPYIVVKARMQLKQSDSNELRYNSVSDGFRKIIAREGLGGLYKGMSTKLVQSVLTASFLFYYKEALYKYAVILLIVLGARPNRRHIA
ncbi:mitochondrial carrier domain-containing protein [Syncephalis fuscata]|nr:mitochondrial carrier domain-containing protein [Syncephalis fuscata]